MNGNQSSVEELNAKRREAVRLRLQGEKLAAAAATTGLSAPTVIAAVRAYREGGWPAVEVSRLRGRPPREQEGIGDEHMPALVQAMLAGPPSHVDIELPLWSRKAVALWLRRHGVSRSSPSAMARLCLVLGLDFDEQ